MNLNWRATFRFLLALSLVLIALPYVIFAVQRLTGGLVSHQEWLVLGQASGPWHGTWQGFTIFFPLIVLVPFTMVLAVIVALLESRWWPLVGALGLVALHIAALIVQVQTLVWLIDSGPGA